LTNASNLFELPQVTIVPKTLREHNSTVNAKKFATFSSTFILDDLKQKK
jgi:hypothetical protein